MMTWHDHDAPVLADAPADDPMLRVRVAIELAAARARREIRQRFNMARLQLLRPLDREILLRRLSSECWPLWARGYLSSFEPSDFYADAVTGEFSYR